MFSSKKEVVSSHMELSWADKKTECIEGENPYKPFRLRLFKTVIISNGIYAVENNRCSGAWPKHSI